MKKSAARDDDGRINIRGIKEEIAEKFDISLQELNIIIESGRGQSATKNDNRKKTSQLPSKRKN